MEIFNSNIHQDRVLTLGASHHSYIRNPGFVQLFKEVMTLPHRTREMLRSFITNKGWSLVYWLQHAE